MTKRRLLECDQCDERLFIPKMPVSTQAEVAQIAGWSCYVDLTGEANLILCPDCAQDARLLFSEPDGQSAFGYREYDWVQMLIDQWVDKVFAAAGWSQGALVS